MRWLVERVRLLGVLVLAGALGACGSSVDGGDDDDDSTGGLDGAASPSAGGRGGTAGAPAGGASGSGGTGAGGTGGAADRGDAGAASDARPGADAAPPPSVPAPRVAISEIMYHPVLERSDVENHEFLELHNTTTTAISLAGWTLSGDVRFTFPAGTSIGPKQFLVVAKNRQTLLAVRKYMLRPEQVVGDYMGELDNGGGRVILNDASGTTIDAAAYDDAFPWPLGADALGAGEAWLKPSDLPLENHRYMGRSLERVSYEVPANEVVNWWPSPLSGATPGRENTVSGPPPGIVVELAVAPEGAATGPVRPGNRAVVRARFAGAPVSGVRLEWFVDDVARTGEMATAVDMQAGADRTFQAALPAQAAGSVVRYRISGDRGKGREPISPRPSDPYEWHGYFVSPEIPGQTRLFHVFVSPADWGKMWTNVRPDGMSGRVIGCPLGVLASGATPTGCPGKCMVNENWNARVPAVLVHEGRVCDVRVRYQGSKVNRLNGRNLMSWTYPRPTAGHTPNLQALSWSIKLPRYCEIENRRTLLMNKNTQACPGFSNYVGGRISEMVGIPASRVRYARLYVNGGYYNYAMDIEHVGEDLLRRAFPRQPLGDLFKSDGLRWDEGPWGWGDQRLLEPYCGYTARQRYEYTYPRKSREWRTHEELVALIEDLHKARAAGAAALRTYLDRTFDLKLLLGYIAVFNWAGAWDDSFHNHYFLKRPADGKWIVMPWDFDNTIVCGGGTCPNAQKSLYIGQQNDPSNRLGLWNYLKDSVFQVYKAEYDQRVKELARTVFEPGAVAALVDQVTSEYKTTEATQALSGVSCTAASVASDIKNFARQRHAYITQRLGM